MSILIKGMEMPKNCRKCRCSWSDFTRLYCEADGKPWGLEVTEYADKRHPDCPIIEVPEGIQPVKHGRWISIGHKLSRICSVCDCDEPYKFAADDANVYDYCPNCGARMDGAE